MLILQGVSYAHPNKEVLFSGMNLVINKHEKIALVGNNGAGKSSLLKLMNGQLQPSSGVVQTVSRPYLVPQIFGQYDAYSVAAALGIEEKLKALREILAGGLSQENFDLLEEDWAIEERSTEALSRWELGGLEFDQPLETLSGGQKTRIFLAGIFIHRPELVLLDEPTNHLDVAGREMLYDYVRTTKDTLLVVSHDRTLLNLPDAVMELGAEGIKVYGGNYDFYRDQKTMEREALASELKIKEKLLRKARDVEREAMERQQKLDARGQKKQEKAGLPRIAMNTLKNNAERSTSKMKAIHAEKTGGLSNDLTQIRIKLPDVDQMKVDFDHARLHKGKVLLDARDVNFGYGEVPLWQKPLSFQVSSGARMAIKGPNGSGKTTLLKMILGDIPPIAGSLFRAEFRSVYVDQEYSLIDNKKTVYEQVQGFNSGELQEHELKVRLNRFLFGREDWDKSCAVLSGGEKMRLVLCCLMVWNQVPDLIVLDEPTNNLDVQNAEIFTTAIRDYQGTLLVVSHDEYFLQQVQLDGSIALSGSSI